MDKEELIRQRFATYELEVHNSLQHFMGHIDGQKRRLLRDVLRIVRGEENVYTGGPRGPYYSCLLLFNEEEVQALAQGESPSEEALAIISEWADKDLKHKERTL